MSDLIYQFAQDIYTTYYPKSRSFEDTQIIDIINNDIKLFIGEYDGEYEEETMYRIEPNDTIETIGKKIRLHVLGVCKGISGTYDTAADEIFEDMNRVNNKYVSPNYNDNELNKIYTELRDKISTLYCNIFLLYNQNTKQPFQVNNIIKDCKNRKM